VAASPKREENGEKGCLASDTLARKRRATARALAGDEMWETKEGCTLYRGGARVGLEGALRARRKRRWQGRSGAAGGAGRTEELSGGPGPVKQ
jgi:hypothetical protein